MDVSSISYGLANALRRVAVGEVGCFAVDKVTFYENTSSIFDEYVSHRIGLVPILTPKGYGETDAIVFSLDVEGPGTAYSKDLKASDKEVKVANENIPLIKLAEGQKIRADCKAIIGKGNTGREVPAGNSHVQGQGRLGFRVLRGVLRADACQRNSEESIRYNKQRSERNT